MGLQASPTVSDTGGGTWGCFFFFPCLSRQPATCCQDRLRHGGKEENNNSSSSEWLATHWTPFILLPQSPSPPATSYLSGLVYSSLSFPCLYCREERVQYPARQTAYQILVAVCSLSSQSATQGKHALATRIYPDRHDRLRHRAATFVFSGGIIRLPSLIASE